MTKAEWRRARSDAPYQQKPGVHDVPVVGRVALCTPSRLVRHSDFVINSSFHISNRRESRNRLADPCQLGRRNYLVNVLVSATCFLGETRP